MELTSAPIDYMIEVNIETAQAVLDTLRILNAIYKYDPSYSIELKSLCLNTSPYRHNVLEWPKSFIEKFLISNCTIEKYSINEKDELFEMLKNMDRFDAALESFRESSYELEDIPPEDILNSPELEKQFLNYLNTTCNYTKYCVKSNLLNSSSKVTKVFASMIPFYLAEYLGITCYYLEHYYFKFEKNINQGELIFIIDFNDAYSDINDSYDLNELKSYVSIFENKLNSLKERQT